MNKKLKEQVNKSAFAMTTAAIATEDPLKGCAVNPAV